MSLVLSACTYKTPPLEYFNQMYDSPAREAQEDDSFSKNGSASRLPPYGAIPIGYSPYPYVTVATPDLLPNKEKGLVNPITNPTLEDFTTGEKKYQIYCAPCHGVQGHGNGTVVGAYPRFANRPPAVVSEKIENWTDGQLYHIITMGRGVMGSYANQVRPQERWQIVEYIRLLQKNEKKNPKLAKISGGSNN